jgi:hypothetical protein
MDKNKSITFSEEEFDLHQGGVAAAHHAAGLEAFAGLLSQRAGKAYVNRLDKEAELLRDLSREAGVIASAKRMEQKDWDAKLAAYRTGAQGGSESDG